MSAPPPSQAQFDTVSPTSNPKQPIPPPPSLSHISYLHPHLQILTNVRNARNVWGEASVQYGAAVTIAVAYFRTLHVGESGESGLEGALGGMVLEEREG